MKRTIPELIECAFDSLEDAKVAHNRRYNKNITDGRFNVRREKYWLESQMAITNAQRALVSILERLEEMESKNIASQNAGVFPYQKDNSNE